jgi:hypothetical protein
MNTSILERTVLAAEYQAKSALRAGRNGDAEGFARHQNRMCDLIEGAAYPRLALVGLVQLLGRAKAQVIGVEKPVIKAALAADAPVWARHYKPVGPVLNLAG